MVIQTLSVDKLVPADYNPRKDLKPGDPEYEKLKRSLSEFGYVEPVIWNKDGELQGGACTNINHGEYLLARNQDGG